MAVAESGTAFAGLVRPISSLRPEPGLRNRGLRSERYRVPGGGAIAVGVEPGDRVRIIDNEGGQPGELLAFDSQGRPALGALGARDSGAASALLALLASEEESAQHLARRLARSGIDLARARAQKLFALDGEAGASASFTSQGSLIVVVVAPGDSMDPTAQNTPTDLFLEIDRAPGAPALVHAAARAAGRPAPGAARLGRHRGRLRGEGGRVDPDHRRGGARMLRLHGLRCAQAGQGHRALPGHHDDALADRPGLCRYRAWPRSSSTRTSSR